MPRNALFSLVILACVLLWPTSALAENSEQYFTLLYTADEHSHILPHSPTLGNEGRGGFARLAGAVAQIREQKQAEGEPVILVSAGDFVGGTPFSWLSMQGHSVELSLMLAIGYDLMTLGNHEFDYGGEDLAAYLEHAGYPKKAQDTAIVATNLVPASGHPLAQVGITQTHLLPLDSGLTLGFFGLIGEHALQVTAHVEGVTFTPQHEAASAAVASLKAEGADLIVGVTHAGVEEDRALAREVPGIHLIVGGHCHTPLPEPLVEGSTIIVQSGPLLHNLGMLELALDPDTQRVRVRNTDLLLPLGADIADDPMLTESIAHYTHLLNELLGELSGGDYHDIVEPVAEMDFPLTTSDRAESTLGNFVTDALRDTVEDVTGQPVAVAMQPNGLLRGPVLPYQGKISLYDLIWPLSLGHGQDDRPGYPVVSFYLTGEEIRRVLEISFLMTELLGDSGFLQVSGLSARYDRSRAILFWIPFLNQPLPTTRAVLTAHWEDGRPLTKDDDTLYHAATDYYTANFIPMVGDMLPSLALTPKDAEGKPIANLRDAIVYKGTEELKVWQAVLAYIVKLPVGPRGLAQTPSRYASVEDRLEEVKTVPLLVWPLAGLALLTGSARWLWVRRKRRRFLPTAS